MYFHSVCIALLLNTCIMMGAKAAAPSTEDCTALQTFDSQLRGFADDIVEAGNAINKAPEDATKSVDSIEVAQQRMQFQVQEMKDEVENMMAAGRRGDPQLTEAQAHVLEAEKMVGEMPGVIAQAQENITNLKAKVDSMTLSPDGVKKLLEETDPEATQDMDLDFPSQEQQMQEINKVIDAGKVVFEKLLADDAGNLQQATERISTVKNNFEQSFSSSDYVTLAKQIKDNLDQLKVFFPQCVAETASDKQDRYYQEKTEL